MPIDEDKEQELHVKTPFVEARAKNYRIWDLLGFLLATAFLWAFYQHDVSSQKSAETLAASVRYFACLSSLAPDKKLEEISNYKTGLCAKMAGGY